MILMHARHSIFQVGIPPLPFSSAIINADILLTNLKMTTTIYHLNCGPIRPFHLNITSVCYVLLVKTNRGWMLVDSGFGKKDLKWNSPFVIRFFQRFMGIPKDESNTAIEQIKGLGIQPSEVKDIVLTHLHLDHAGGVSDFPWATVHVFESEYKAAMKHQGKIGIGYVRRQWRNHQNWVFYQPSGDSWFNFPAIKIPDLEPTIFLIPTPGHTIGHCMVAIQNEEGWILHGGDAIFPFYLDPSEQKMRPPKGLISSTFGIYIPAIKEVLTKHGDKIQIICGHDGVSFEKNRHSLS